MNLVSLHSYFQMNGIDHFGGDTEGIEVVYYDPNNPKNKKVTIPKKLDGDIKPEVITIACLILGIPVPTNL